MRYIVIIYPKHYFPDIWNVISDNAEGSLLARAPILL